MSFDLRSSAKERLLIAAHRGSCGGNIPCNTLASYEAALFQGADMIEIDVDMTGDGKLVIFHPGMEKPHLDIDGSIEEMPFSEVRKLHYVNGDRTETQFSINTLEEVLAAFKGRCFINVDKFWKYPKEISEMIRSFGMTEQILVKTRPDAEMFDIIERYAPDMQYMVIASSDAESLHGELKKRRINYMGQELIFDSEDSPLCSQNYLDRLKQDNVISWVNTIVYYYIRILCAGHNDDVSITGNPDNGWGWCARRGFDIIQTDWVLACRKYLADNGLLSRKQPGLLI